MNNFINLTASLLFYLIPIGMGMLFTLIVSKKALTKYFIFNAFAIGGLISYLLFLLNIDVVIGTIVILLLSLGGFAVLLFFKKPKLPSVNSGNVKHSQTWATTLAVVMALSLLVYGLWRIDSPTNTSLNWDLYHHQTLANIISKGEFSFLSTKLSDTFKFAGYSTIFHSLLALSQMLFKVDILGFWWYLEFFHLVSTVLASFVVAYSFTKSRYVGFAAAIIGAFVFEAHGAYTSLFLIPQNLSATLGAVLISQLYAQYKRKKDIFRPIYLLSLVFIILNHFIVGALVLVLYTTISLMLALHQSQKLKKIFDLVVIFALLSCVMFPVITANIDLSYLNRGEAQFFNFSLAQKLSYNKSFYGNSLYPLVALGLLAFTALRNRKNYLLIFLTLVSASLLLAPVPYSTKLYALNRYFVHTTMALGLWLVVRNTNYKKKLASLILLIMVFSVVFISNVTTYKQIPYYRETSTHISPNEIETASYIKNTYKNKDILLLSDPATMHVLEAISGVNTPGGAYTDLRTRQTLTNIYYTRNSKSMALSLLQARDGLNLQPPQKILLVVGGRLAKWEQASDENRNGIHWNVWVPYDIALKDLETYDFIDFVENYSKFKLVYKNSGMVVFEVENNAKLF